MIPKINSAHGSDTRNIINRAIDSINAQGKSIQDLVAEGQLTEEQYAELLTTINGLVKSGQIDKSDLTSEFKDEIEEFNEQLAQTQTEKISHGNVAVSDIDKNKGKFDQTFMTDEFIEQFVENTQPINNTPPIEGVVTRHLAKRAVTPETTSFTNNPKNLFNLDRNTLRNYNLDGQTGQPVPFQFIGATDFINAKPNVNYISSDIDHVYFYDEAKNYLSRTGGDSFITPENTFFMRFTFVLTKIDSCQVNEGSILGDYDVKEYKIDEKELAIPQREITTKTTSFFVPSENLFNKNQVDKGKSVDIDGNIVEQSAKNLSGYIRVKPNHIYSNTTGYSTKIGMYTKDKVFIKRLSLEADTLNFETSPWAEYIRVTVDDSEIDNYMLNEGHELLPYKDYKSVLKSSNNEPIEIDSDLLIGGTTRQNSEVWFSSEDIINYYNPIEESSVENGNFGDVVTTTSYEDYIDAWRTLVANNPKFLTEIYLGKDTSGIYDMYRFKTNTEDYDIRIPSSMESVIKDFPEVLIVGGLHGEEKHSVFSLYHMIRDVAENWQTNEFLEYMRFNVHFDIMPVANPWGFMEGYAGSRFNVNGVDLNRNFSEGFGGASNEGTEPFSELESQYIRDMILEHPNATYFFDYHTNGSSGTDWNNMYWMGLYRNGTNKYFTNIVRASKTALSKCSRQWIHENDVPSTQDVIGFIYFDATAGTATSFADTNGIPSCTLECAKKFPHEENRQSGFIRTANKAYVGNTILNMLKEFKNNPLK